MAQNDGGAPPILFNYHTSDDPPAYGAAPAYRPPAESPPPPYGHAQPVGGRYVFQPPGATGANAASGGSSAARAGSVCGGAVPPPAALVSSMPMPRPVHVVNAGAVPRGVGSVAPTPSLGEDYQAQYRAYLAQNEQYRQMRGNSGAAMPYAQPQHQRVHQSMGYVQRPVQQQQQQQPARPPAHLPRSASVAYTPAQYQHSPSSSGQPKRLAQSHSTGQLPVQHVPPPHALARSDRPPIEQKPVMPHAYRRPVGTVSLTPAQSAAASSGAGATGTMRKEEPRPASQSAENAFSPTSLKGLLPESLHKTSSWLQSWIGTPAESGSGPGVSAEAMAPGSAMEVAGGGESTARKVRAVAADGSSKGFFAYEMENNRLLSAIESRLDELAPFFDRAVEEGAVLLVPQDITLEAGVSDRTIQSHIVRMRSCEEMSAKLQEMQCSEDLRRSLDDELSLLLSMAMSAGGDERDRNFLFESVSGILARFDTNRERIHIIYNPLVEADGPSSPRSSGEGSITPGGPAAVPTGVQLLREGQVNIGSRPPIGLILISEPLWSDPCEKKEEETLSPRASTRKDDSEGLTLQQQFEEKMATREARKLRSAIRSAVAFCLQAARHRFVKSFNKRKQTDPVVMARSAHANMAMNSLWASSSKSDIQTAKECLSKYLFNQIYDNAFCLAPDAKDDDLFLSSVGKLWFISPEHLDIAEAESDSVVLEVAIREVNQLEEFRAPREKLECLLNCCRIIIFMLNSKGEISSADDFLPHFIYCVLTAKPKHVHSNIEYIKRFCERTEDVGEAFYYLTMLESAVYFIENVSAENLNIEEHVFVRYTTCAEPERDSLPPAPVKKPVKKKKPRTPKRAPPVVAEDELTVAAEGEQREGGPREGELPERELPEGELASERARAHGSGPSTPAESGRHASAGDQSLRSEPFSPEVAALPDAPPPPPLEDDRADEPVADVLATTNSAAVIGGSSPKEEPEASSVVESTPSQAGQGSIDRIIAHASAEDLSRDDVQVLLEWAREQRAPRGVLDPFISCSRLLEAQGHTVAVAVIPPAGPPLTYITGDLSVSDILARVRQGSKSAALDDASKSTEVPPHLTAVEPLEHAPPNAGKSSSHTIGATATADSVQTMMLPPVPASAAAAPDGASAWDGPALESTWASKFDDPFTSAGAVSALEVEHQHVPSYADGSSLPLSPLDPTAPDHDARLAEGGADVCPTQ